MPGIHVRSLGKLDWVERGNEPILTVPGAYWLCHKKHIYKFTFKWHKTLRNTEGFAYPKELTKVIRRIIKSQPQQGQQFGTRHLLVTYNHSAWMRQDKMFAMLKFQDRSDATAFPYAFVLTVKTLDTSATEEPHQARQDKDSTLTILEDAKNARLQDTRRGKNEENPQDISEDDQSINRCPDLRSKGQMEIFAKVTHSEKSTAATPSSSSSREAENDRRKDPGKKATKRSKSYDKNDASPLSKKRNRQGQRISENKETSMDLIEEKEIATDSADLPYQYIIEKEIENSKNVTKVSSPGSSHRESNNSGKSLARSPKIVIADTARSADITDLVMEGLMFTIRQDQDSVTVVEQKTKLEMDEVLENSEKAETKQGEKCLLNSSLLRLENLITKIEMSEARLRNNADRSKLQTTSDYSASRSKFDETIVRNDSSWKYESYSLPSQPTSVPEMPKFPLVKINLSNIRDVLNDTLPFDSETKTLNAASEHEAMELYDDKNEMINVHDFCNYEEEEEEEEEEEDEVGLELKYEDKDEEEDHREDIVPEILRDNQREELLMDDETTEVSPHLLKHDPSSTPLKDCIETMKSKVPRIVSNEIVTDDQIPPELQRVLREKRRRRLFLSEIERNVNSNSTEETAKPEMELPASLPIEEEPKEKSEEIATIDITEEFERELSCEKPRGWPTRRKSLRRIEGSSRDGNRATEEPEIHIEMWKFIQDISRGAKVVIDRLDLANIPNNIVTDSSLHKYNSNRRYVDES